MEVYVARQPIFDRSMRVFGYELLYRKTANNFYEGSNGDQATATLITNSFLLNGFSNLVQGGFGFINFPSQLILEQIPLLLPANQLIVEILETVEPSAELLENCRMLKAKGYQIALDDFVLNDQDHRYDDLAELADIIKIDIVQTSWFDQMKILRKYRGKVQFLAEKVESREIYHQALEMGYTYFQGYFFSRPQMIQTKDIQTLNSHLVMISHELQKADPDHRAICKIIEKDAGLTCKLLRMVNSAFYRPSFEAKSVQDALLLLGHVEMRKWIQLLMIRDLQSRDMSELIRFSLIRGRTMALLARETGQQDREFDYFITGLFSSIDVILNRKITPIIKELPLSEPVKNALTGIPNDLRQALDLILTIETANWESLDAAFSDLKINQDSFMTIYLEAIAWMESIPC